MLREDFAAPLALRVAVAARVPVKRVAPVLDDFARVDDAFFAPAEREPVAAFRVLLLERPEPLLLRAELDDEVDAPPLLAEPSKLHLPDITRCAASATASAMIEPNLVALDIMLVAACDAVSAASNPASRILRRAAGLALIAAAAAASPAASISLLIAALASLSTVMFDFEVDREDDRLDDFLEALAIAFLPPSLGKDTSAA